MTRLPASLVVGSLLALPLAAQGHVHRVSPSGEGDFRDLPEAVAAARSGDVLLLADGTYAGFELTSKALAVVAEPGASVLVRGPLTVQGASRGTSSR